MRRLNGVLLLYLSLFAPIVLAEGGGLNINYKNINIRLEFNDNIKEDRVTGMQYIREPSGFLYDLIYLMQNNRPSLDNIKQDIYIEADNLNKSLSIYLKNQPQGYILDSSNVEHFSKNQLLNGICQSLKLNPCATDINNSGTYIYFNKKNTISNTANLIEFGCFPCANKRNYTLTPPTHKANSLKINDVEKLKINRDTITRYFTKL